MNRLQADREGSRNNTGDNFRHPPRYIHITSASIQHAVDFQALNREGSFLVNLVIQYDIVWEKATNYVRAAQYNVHL